LPEAEQATLLEKLQQGERLCVRIPKTRPQQKESPQQSAVRLFNWRSSLSTAASLLFVLLLSGCADASEKEPCPVNTNNNGHPEYKMGKPMSASPMPAAGQTANIPPKNKPPLKDDRVYTMGETSEPQPQTPNPDPKDMSSQKPKNDDEPYLLGEIAEPPRPKPSEQEEKKD
jgi:hypothetical protein